MTVPTGERVPRADCIADAAGGVTFDIAGTGAPGALLVLRRRGGAGDTVRLPLTPAGGNHSRAVLPSTVELAEGHWDAYTDDGAAVEPGIRDLRALVGRVPEAVRIAVRVPYPTADGRLAVRCWVREPHAEAGDIAVSQGACTVEGVLYGAVLGAGAVAEARLGETVHRVPPTADCAGGRFAVTLEYATLAGPAADGERLWTLWLRPSADAEPVRISRILDDVWDRRNVFVYPAHEGEGYRAAPCYTADNDLCVRLSPPG
ncbi:hypothetical protein [Streptomyces wuyuanensis]|uniref:Transferase n=1 Tax=Streptomyces wuyuanensis TaxID=1196353 RepID=A0A1H0D792_9ACTN|nr:hypothetical protein [Streptomyces wuyuanensis]SDN65801.1 hypothetical protein SAMN05444921_13249 [Streptomyces wuyuanensis]